MTFSSADEAYVELLGAAASSSVRSSPRGLETREIDHLVCRIENPRNRLITNATRRWNIGLAFGELAWHLSGSRDVEGLAAYARVWRRFAVGQEIHGSCYGYRMFSPMSQGRSQWEICRELLVADPDTRRAVIQLYDPDQNYVGSPDVSCAMSVQFNIRDGNLDLTVLMRSNDAYFGFPYDVYLYTVLQELMAVEIGRPIGRYTHLATSFHLYEKDIRKVDGVLSGRRRGYGEDLPISIPGERAKYCDAERHLRLWPDASANFEFSDEFWRHKYLYLLGETDGRSRSYYRDF
ncbi:MAG: hypothetical protein JSR72_05795 [Proteobacteria bacterium]|nr:hypothetical protein [Pseudomonadota bacterium]